MCQCCPTTSNFLRNLCCCFAAEDSEENGRLLTKSIYVTTSESQKHCLDAFRFFKNKYLSSCNLKIKDLRVIENKVIIVCPKTSRFQDDVTDTLKDFQIRGQPNMMFVVMHNCERGVMPENLITEKTDRRVTNFTNVLYSDSEQCYDSPINNEAADDIKRFIRSG
ncbi:uncharacterized protein LOC133185418 [Saccostrea echinata]|uniref:uncharacterized protein LOC133185418 n=1 Tax=Saccostrea echinata TaxID=191078 RepID=UPI002A7F5578|nr:uncharacterized protein LOC133185418 [Saccostrea echinata]